MTKQFNQTLKNITVLENSKAELLHLWTTTQDVQKVLQHHDIGIQFFSKYFGAKIIEYAIGVIKKKNELGNCPVVGVMLHFFEKKNIPLQDVFTICVNLKNTLLGYMLEKKLLNQSLLLELNTLMDHNFSGVIQEYLNLHYNPETKYEICNLSSPLFSTIANENGINFSSVSKNSDLSAKIDPSLCNTIVELEQSVFDFLRGEDALSTTSMSYIVRLLRDYNLILKELSEYDELNSTLSNFMSMLETFNPTKSKTDNILFIKYIKTLVDDFSMWRVTVIFEEGVRDIHYMDQSILSTIASLEELLLECNNSHVNEMDDQKETQQLIDTLQRTKETTVTSWLENPYVISLLKKYGIDEWYYKEHYAYLMYERVIDHVTNSEKANSFTAIHHMIDYFNNRDFIPSDMYTFFTIYRQYILKTFLDTKNGRSQMYLKIQEFLDQEYIEALNYYNQSFFGKRDDYKGQLAIFWQYQKMIDKSAIVSKSDLRGVITYINQHFCDVSGYKPEELLGKPHSIVRHPDTPPEVFKELWETIQAKKIFKARIKNRKKNGETYYVDSTIVPILDENNDIVQYISMRYDVTELVEAVEIADKAKRIRDEFLANMSHEIRTPLNGIIGFVEILLRQNNDKKNNHYLEIIYSSAQMLLRIVNDVLELSKLQSGKFVIEMIPFNPIEEISTIVSLFNSKVYEKSLKYTVYIDPNMPRRLYGDGGRIKQIVSNFLSNAIKFTPNGGTIKIKAIYEKGILKVMVQDNGIGINLEHQNKIFCAFEQADASITRSYGGTGLGLSISTELISNMKGKLLFRSIENKGSTFGFEIPCSISHDESKKLSIEGKYSALRVAIVIDPKNSSLNGLIEKYLQDYGVKSMEKIPNVEEGNFDLIFCPSSMLNADQKSNSGSPIIVLENSLSEVENKKQFTYILYSPFLPNDIETVLDEIKTK